VANTNVPVPVASDNALPPKKPVQSAQVSIEPQTLNVFMQRKFPPKDPLIEGVLYRRDQISLTGRRRHGKTTLLGNLAIAGALGKEYLGFCIPRPFTTVAFLLEDDAGELQDKFRRMLGKEEMPKSVHVYTRNDFVQRKIPIDMGVQSFRDFVLSHCLCDDCKPDLVIFDNLGMLIGADYNNSTRIHSMTDITYKLTQQLNAAVLIAAHPRKGAGTSLDTMGDRQKITLANNPEEFFEATMGSSHFINSTGSLWGIERDEEDQTTVLLGSQRVTGRQSITRVEKNENDWFDRLDDSALAFAAAVNTPKRVQAWSLLPKQPATFSYLDAETLLGSRKVLAPSNFNAWFKELRRVGLITEPKPEKYSKTFVSDSEKAAEAAAKKGK
jgi:hypothetical protein